MDATCGTALQFSSPWIDSKMERQLSDCLSFSQRCRNDYRLKAPNTTESRWRSDLSRYGRSSLTVSYACKDSHAPALEMRNLHASFDRNWLLKEHGQEVHLRLNGRSVFLVGMMGSGKTTVGQVLSEVLGYSFVDSDKYVEQALGNSPVAQIFEQHGERFFRYFESEALRELSRTSKQVVATGGGAVVLPTNWKHMKQGVTVYLDVPWDPLARRIAAVGTDSRPLLDFESGSHYSKAFMGLSTLSKKRQHAYANADATVSIRSIADKLGVDDLCDIGPSDIALEVLVQIEKFLQGKNNTRFI